MIILKFSHTYGDPVSMPIFTCENHMILTWLSHDGFIGFEISES